MLRIRRSVQAKYNTEASYLAAQTLAARDGKVVDAAPVASALDPMAAAEQAGASKGGFVAAKHGGPSQEAPENGAGAGALESNAEEIQIDDDDM